jgi:NADH-quinone oxidoreductase subunit M
LPGLNGFIGEFLILSGTYQSNPRAAIIATTGVILAAIYLLWLVQKVFYGPITKEENKHVPEIAWNEVAALVPLIVFMVWIGVHPSTFLDKMSPSVKELISVVKTEKQEKVYQTLLPATRGEGAQRADEGRPHPAPLTRPRVLAADGGAH